MPLKKKKPTDKEFISIWIGPGRFSFPSLSAPDIGRKFSDGSYKTDLVIPKAIFIEKNKDIQKAVLRVGREAFGAEFNLKGDCDQRTPFKDSDEDEKITIESMKNSIIVRAKTTKPTPQRPAKVPTFISARKGADGKFRLLTPEEIADIKGGDWGKILVSVYAYQQEPGGVSFGLQAVQFWKEGEAFGQGKTRILESAEELEEEELDDATDSTEDDDDDDIMPVAKKAAPKAAKAKAKKAPVVEEEDEDDDLMS